MTTFVRYGADGEYSYYQVEQSVVCNNATFGDVIHGVAKHCYYFVSSTVDTDGDGVVDSEDFMPNNPLESKDTDGDNIGDIYDPNPEVIGGPIPYGAKWVYCSDEGEECSVPAPAAVRYGANGSYLYKHVPQSMACTNAAFGGDPIGNVEKHCEYILSSAVDFDNDGLTDNIDPYPSDSQNNPSAHWQHCANQNENCIVPNKSLVRYGADNSYHFQVVENRQMCSTGVFGGDPIVGVNKSCDYLSFTPVITNEIKKGWFELGEENSIAVATGHILIFDNNDTPYITYHDSDSQQIILERFNGSFWEKVQTNIIASNSGAKAIGFDNNNVLYMVYSVPNGFGANTLVKRLNGTTWEAVGSGTLEDRITFYTSMRFDSNNIPYIGYVGFGVHRATVKKFNGTTWEAVGSEEFSERNFNTLSFDLDHNGLPYVSYLDSDASRGIVQRFNGTSWEVVGGDYISEGSATPLVIINNDNIPYVLYREGFDYIIKRFNGEQWESVPLDGLSSVHGPWSVDANGELYLIGRNHPKITLEQFDYDGEFWKSFTDEGFYQGGASYISSYIGSNNTPYVTYKIPETNIVKVKRFYDAIVHTMFDQQINAIDIDATDFYDGALVYSLTNSYDAALFSINETNGLVTFNTAPDVEHPQDNDQNNIYVFEVQVTDEFGGIVSQKS